MELGEYRSREDLIKIHEDLCDKYFQASGEKERELYDSIALVEVLLLSSAKPREDSEDELFSVD